MEIEEIREKGIGNGFTVVNPEDGFRKDNTIWFGNCSKCGNRVSNSIMTKFVWKHQTKCV